MKMFARGNVLESNSINTWERILMTVPGKQIGSEHSSMVAAPVLGVVRPTGQCWHAGSTPRVRYVPRGQSSHSPSEASCIPLSHSSLHSWKNFKKQELKIIDAWKSAVFEYADFLFEYFILQQKKVEINDAMLTRVTKLIRLNRDDSFRGWLSLQRDIEGENDIT